MKYLCNIFSLEKPPYIFFVFFGAFSFLIGNLNIENSNALVYNFEKLDSQITNDTLIRKFECEIYNLSNKEALKNIELVIKFSTKLKPLRIVKHPNIITKERANLSNKMLYYNISNIENRYEIPIIQPNSSYILEFETITNVNNNNLPKLYSGNDKTVIRLIPKTFLTIIKKNIIIVNILALFFILITFIVLFIHYKICKNEKHQNHHYFSSSSNSNF